MTNVGDKLATQLNKSGDIIKITKNSNSNGLQTFENITYKGLGSNFVLNEERSSNKEGEKYKTYFLNNDSSENFKAAFKVGGTNYGLYDILTSKDVSIFGFSFKNTNSKELVNKYKINDDYDLIKYIINHYKDSVNVFSSTDEIKMNYLIKTFANVVLPVSQIYLIDGDLKGYMYTVNNNQLYEVHLIDNGENYWFTFINGKNSEYFAIDDVEEFLSNVDYTK
jgi:hypothetical protein